jgi:hypothetical protein
MHVSTRRRMYLMRPWNIEEQAVEVEGSKWLVEFTSAHSEAIKAGEDVPDHDRHLTMRIWNEGRTRYMILNFDRGGAVTHTSVEPADPTTAPDYKEPEVQEPVEETRPAPYHTEEARRPVDRPPSF